MTRWSWAGGQLDLAPERGRVGQLVLDGEPAFWTPAEPVGWNVGGDRLWLGPERDWFWATDVHASSGDVSDHVVPPEIDPGEWVVAGLADGSVELTADVDLRHRRSGAVTAVALRRRIELLSAAAECASYQVRTELLVRTGPPGQTVSAWSVLQVPDGGTLRIALAGLLAYRDYLAPVDPARWRVEPGAAELRLTGERMIKVGLPPSVVAGRLRYDRPVPGGTLRVEREFEVWPGRRYTDHPLGADQTGQGDTVQVFDDDGHYGGYAELEHHSPAAGVGERVVDTCRTTVTLLRD